MNHLPSRCVQFEIDRPILGPSGQYENLAVHGLHRPPSTQTFKPVSPPPTGIDSPLPLLSETYDCILLMETIEHIPDQFLLLQEIARILKPNGRLILTKPNNSSFSGRLANLWTEGERSNMYLPNEKTLISYDNGNEYLGRFFLLGAQKLRSLAAKSKLDIEEIYPNQFSNSSLVWGILLYPFLWIRSVLTRRKLTKNLPAASEEITAINEQHQLNINPTVLLHKHFCVVFQKVAE